MAGENVQWFRFRLSLSDRCVGISEENTWNRRQEFITEVRLVWVKTHLILGHMPCAPSLNPGQSSRGRGRFLEPNVQHSYSLWSQSRAKNIGLSRFGRSYVCCECRLRKKTDKSGLTQCSITILHERNVLFYWHIYCRPPVSPYTGFSKIPSEWPAIQGTRVFAEGQRRNQRIVRFAMILLKRKNRLVT